MSKNLLLLSYGGPKSEPYLNYAKNEIAELYGASPENRKKVLFIPNASVDENFDARLRETKATLEPLGIDLISSHHFDDPTKALNYADGVLVGGGNTYKLLTYLQKTGLDKAIKEKVAKGFPYAGESAGANVAGLDIGVTNDKPYRTDYLPSSLEALGLVPYNFNPHFPEGVAGYLNEEGNFVPFGPLDREKQLTSVHRNNIPIIGLPEGSGLRISDEGNNNIAVTNYKLVGNNPVLLFEKGEETLKVTEPIILRVLGVLEQFRKEFDPRSHNENISTGYENPFKQFFLRSVPLGLASNPIHEGDNKQVRTEKRSKGLSEHFDRLGKFLKTEQQRTGSKTSIFNYIGNDKANLDEVGSRRAIVEFDPGENNIEEASTQLGKNYQFEVAFFAWTSRCPIHFHKGAIPGYFVVDVYPDNISTGTYISTFNLKRNETGDNLQTIFDDLPVGSLLQKTWLKIPDKELEKIKKELGEENTSAADFAIQLAKSIKGKYGNIHFEISPEAGFHGKIAAFIQTGEQILKPGEYTILPPDAYHTLEPAIKGQKAFTLNHYTFMPRIPKDKVNPGFFGKNYQVDINGNNEGSIQLAINQLYDIRRESAKTTSPFYNSNSGNIVHPRTNNLGNLINHYPYKPVSDDLALIPHPDITIYDAGSAVLKGKVNSLRIA